MARYLLRRLIGGVPIILGVTLITFVLFHAVGGNPVVAFLGKSAAAADIAALEHEYGFDRPIWVQYLRYLLEIGRLDFGKSFVSHEPVSALLWRGLGPSLSLTVPGLFASVSTALGVALFAARARGRGTDRALMLLAVAGMSVSYLVYIVVAQYLFAFLLPLFPIHGYEPGLFERWPYLALPILIIVAVSVGYDARFFRAALLAELDRDYVLTARAKGLSETRILLRHVLKNAALPITTWVLSSLPFLLTGSLLLESFFGIPGLGGTLLSALEAADFPVIKAYTVMISVAFVLSNLLIDVLYAALDPRVRLS